MCNDECNNKPRPHKHAALIKAWADGAQIQSRSNEAQPWTDAKSPMWYESTQYRLKPQNRVVTAKLFLEIYGSHEKLRVYSFDEQSNVRATFDPEGNLLAVELIKGAP